MSDIFNPDPNAPAWVSAIPTEEDLRKAKPEQRALWQELNAEIARIHTAWASLELNLGFLLAALLHIKVAQAQVILATLTSNRTKRQVISNISIITLSADSRRRQIARFLRRTANVAKKRNGLAHGMALYSQKYPDCITVHGVSAESDPALITYLAYTKDDLRRIKGTLEKLAEDIYDAIGPIWRSRRFPLPETPLQRHGGVQAMLDNRHQLPPEMP